MVMEVKETEKSIINNTENVDRHTAYNALPDNIRDYSERVAYNSKLIFAELLRQKIYTDYADLSKENLNIIFDAVKYFDIGFAFKTEGAISEKVIPIMHVNIGADIFFNDIKTRADFKALTIYEKKLRTIAKDVTTYHHEQWDGNGYPLGLIKEEIPIIARICSVCLAFEELTNRNDGNQKTRFNAIKEITKLSGINFDPIIVDVMVGILPMLVVKGEIFDPNEEIIIEEPQEEVVEEVEEVTEPVKEEVKEIKEDKLTKKKKASRPIELLYSPVQNIRTKKYVYFNSELVINDRYYGAMKPVLYASIAEKMGKMTDIILIALTQAIEFIKLAKLCNVEFDGLLFKLYPSIVEKETNLNKVLKLVEKSGIDPNKIIFEIAESTFVTDDEKVIKNIDSIKKNKFRIAICEFGEEYSSLSRIGDFDFDILIIGSSFVRKVDTNTKVAGVVRGLIDLAKNLGVDVICEKVSNDEQLQILKKLGCNMFEGRVIGEVQTYKEILSE